MSRMPGPGTGALGTVMAQTSWGLASGGGSGGRTCRGVRRRRRRQFGRGERHGVAAEPQQPEEVGAELRAKFTEARIGQRHKAVDLNEAVGPLGMLAGG